MKVEELIVKLQSMKQDYEVRIMDQDMRKFTWAINERIKTVDEDKEIILEPVPF